MPHIFAPRMPPLRRKNAKASRLSLLAACKTLGILGNGQTRHAAVRVSFRSFMVQRDQWDTSWGPKKLIFLIREIDDAAMAGASVESCRFVVLRSSRGRLGSSRDMCNRLRRMRGRFDRWIHISTGPQQSVDKHHDPQKISIQSSLESTERERMRSTGPPDLRSIPEGVREPTCIRKK